MKKVLLRIGVMAVAYVIVSLIMLNITNPTGKINTFFHPQPNITNIHTMYVKSKNCSSVYELEKLLTDLDIDFSIDKDIVSTQKIKFRINEDKTVKVLKSSYTIQFERIDNYDKVRVENVKVDGREVKKITNDYGFIKKIGNDYYVNRCYLSFLIPLMTAFAAFMVMLFMAEYRGYNC